MVLMICSKRSGFAAYIRSNRRETTLMRFSKFSLCAGSGRETDARNTNNEKRERKKERKLLTPSHSFWNNNVSVIEIGLGDHQANYVHNWARRRHVLLVNHDDLVRPIEDNCVDNIGMEFSRVAVNYLTVPSMHLTKMEPNELNTSIHTNTNTHRVHNTKHIFADTLTDTDWACNSVNKLTFPVFQTFVKWYEI